MGLIDKARDVKWSLSACQQVQAEHLGCWRAENPTLILEELL